jgi:cytoskeletal protein CcmA (bactofilin family)
MKDFTLNLGNAKGRRTLDKVAGFSTTVGEQCRIDGTFSGQGHYIVYGYVEGDSEIEGTMVIAETGKWIGNIKADTVLIAGLVEGDIVATEKLEIISTAKVNGKITSSVLAIAEGAVHQGEVDMATGKQVTRYHDRRDAKD